MRNKNEMHEYLHLSDEIFYTIQRILNTTPTCESDCFGEDETICFGVVFDDDKQADVKLCGVQYECGQLNLPWCEMVLFDQYGHQLAFTEPQEEYFGEWSIEYNNTVYIVNVVRTGIDDMETW